MDERRLAPFGTVVIINKLHRRADFASNGSLRQIALGLLGQGDLAGLRTADKKHLGAALADFFHFLRADRLRGFALASGELLAPRLDLAGNLDINVAIKRLLADHDLAEAESRDLRISRLDAVLLLERTAADLPPGEGHRPQHHSIVA